MGLIVDSFAGGGGTSTGIRMATGRDPDIAINHNAEAMAMHKANHPNTKHYIEDIRGLDPLSVTKGEQVDLMWLSPDCTHFSKARGSKPRSEHIRGLAWTAVKWARRVRPKLIILENVEEFQDWCPLKKKNNMPKMHLRGITFNKFVRHLRREGYSVSYRELVASEYGAPTTRKRFFLIATSDRTPANWPVPTHGRGPGLMPFKTAAECIDWSISCPSIFGRKKPLAEKTMKRIARGIFKFVINNPTPFIVSFKNGEQVCDINNPLATQTSKDTFGLVLTELTPVMTAPIVVQIGYGERKGQKPRVIDVKKTLGTIVGARKHALAAYSLTRQFGSSTGQSLDSPMPTVMPQGSGKTDLVSAFLTKYYGNEKDGCCLEDPIATITGKDRMGLVTVTIGGENYIITDIGLRMLQPRELFNAQGFPADYIIDPIYNGKPLTKTAQVRMCGNSVCPPLAEALIRANYTYVEEREAA